MRLENLDTPGVRNQMLAEIIADEAESRLYRSGRLSPRGIADFPGLLREAAESHDVTWLAAALRQHDRMNRTERRHGKKGAETKDVSRTASETLAEGEMNRYYMRGLCLVLLGESPEAEVEVYRAKRVTTQRPGSRYRVGLRLKAADLLADLRANRKETDFGIPGGPNSGLSVRIPVG